jgi:hypothetical protein
MKGKGGETMAETSVDEGQQGVIDLRFSHDSAWSDIKICISKKGDKHGFERNDGGNHGEG